MSLPKKISPCPIFEALAEIRFDINYPSEVIFGIVFDKLKDEYSNPITLPITQIPEQLRKIDPNLKFKPYYQLENDKYILRLGPDVLALSSSKGKQGYPGWEIFGEEIKKVFEKIVGTGIIKKVNRLAIRYINFFDGNIFENIKANLFLNEEPHLNSAIIIQFAQESHGFKHHIRIANDAEISVEQSSISASGSVIDIDTVLMEYPSNILNNLSEYFKQAHIAEKELFFDLLKSDFLKTLNPEY